MPSILVAVLLALQSQPSPDSLPERILSGVVWIRSTDGIGAGWIFDRQRKQIVTCLHVVGDAKTVEVFFADRLDGRYITRRSHYVENRADLARRGRLVSGRVVARSEACDLAAIEVDTLPEDAIALAVGTPAIGEPVVSLGHRQDSETLWLPAFGIVRQVGKLTDGYFWNAKKLAADIPAVFVSSPILPGDSGGPVVDRRGRVVGILSAVRWKAPQVSVAIDVSQLARLGLKPPEAKPEAKTSNADRLADATVRIAVSGSSARHAGVVLEGSPTLVLTCAAAGGTSREVDVLLPLRDTGGRILPEDDRYTDPISLRRSGRLIRGLVLARDAVRDLTLIELPRLPEGVRPVSLSDRPDAKPGEEIISVNHPSGVEVGWLLSQGIIRTVAPVKLDPDAVEGQRRPLAYLVQIPGSPGSSGGGLMRADGSLAGIFSTREAAQQQVAFAVVAAEIVAFLEEVKPLYAPVDADGFVRRVEYFRQHSRPTAALTIGLVGLYRHPAEPRIATLVGNIIIGSDAPGDAVVLEAKRLEVLGRSEAALTAYGRAIERYPSMSEALRNRGRLYGKLGDGKRAAIDAAALVELRPADASARIELARAWLVRGDEEKATIALVEAHRLGSGTSAGELVSDYAERLRRDWPDSPDRPVRWLRGYADRVERLPTSERQ